MGIWPLEMNREFHGVLLILFRDLVQKVLLRLESLVQTLVQTLDQTLLIFRPRETLVMLLNHPTLLRSVQITKLILIQPSLLTTSSWVQGMN
uniref:Uncharacterized protein n=1 Tax=uncultured marine virus TaxID=186617 RepID=A0A0F7L623_9VIRU|nr:hypothetical protein [uncultured marine virus]